MKLVQNSIFELIFTLEKPVNGYKRIEGNALMIQRQAEKVFADLANCGFYCFSPNFPPINLKIRQTHYNENYTS